MGKHELERGNLPVRAVALIYNWWRWYVRLTHPQTCLEAIYQPPYVA